MIIVLVYGNLYKILRLATKVILSPTKIIADDLVFPCTEKDLERLAYLINNSHNKRIIYLHLG